MHEKTKIGKLLINMIIQYQYIEKQQQQVTELIKWKKYASAIILYAP